MAKIYRVSGGSRVAGHNPGETFEHYFPPHEEKALLEGGAIVIVPGLRAEPERTQDRKRTEKHIPTRRTD